MSAYTQSLLAAEIGSIRSQLANVLEGDWRSVLDQALQQARSGVKSGAAWVFQIHKEAPLRFRQTDYTETGIPVRIDISGTFLAPATDGPFHGHSVIVRVWATRMADYYHKDEDAKRLKRKCFARGRVISRFLFDTVKSPVEPWCHLHFGGSDRESHEYCRMPEALEVPRFVHHPMGLIQACEFVLFHFYPRDYATVSRDQTWQHSLRESEKAYLEAYIGRVAPLSRKWPGEGSFLQHCCAAR